LDVFAYGTLQIAEVMEEVTGLRPRGRPARLSGFARFRVRDDVYPGIVERAGAETPGLLYQGLGSSAVALLDRFEGNMYERRVLEVVREDGRAQPAAVYVVVSAAEHLLSGDPWDLEEFTRHHLSGFVHAR